MNNKKYIQDISKKNNINLRRNSSLDSTKSSLRVKKIQLYNEFTPFSKNKQNQSGKNIIDFPICMSLFTNNHSQTEKDKKAKNNSTSEININFKNLKSNIFKKNNQNELLLPKTKRIISRNANNLLIHSFSPINSIIKNSILNYNKLSIKSFRNITKPINHKINYSLLTNITKQKQKDNGINILKWNKYKYNQKYYNLSNSTIEQEISTIPHISNNITINNKKKFKLPLPFFTPKVNGRINETNIFPTSRLDINKKKEIQRYIISEEINNNITNNTNHKNNTISTLFQKYNRANNIKENKNDNKLKLKNILQNNDKSKTIERSVYESSDTEEDKKDKLELEKNKKGHQRHSAKKKTLSIEQEKDNEDDKNKAKEIEENKNNEKSPSNLMIEKEKLIKIKESKFYLAINNKKTIEIYNNNTFLNDYNKIINEKSINKSINMKIFLQKTEMLIKDKESIQSIIAKQTKQLKEIETVPFSETTKQKMMSDYYKKAFKKYKNKNMAFTIKRDKKINCNLCYSSRNHILNSTNFGELTIANSSNKAKIKYKKRGSVIQNIKLNKNIPILKRQNTYFNTKNIHFNSDLDDAFSIKKTKNNIKKDIKVNHNPGNLISIQNYILKSLPYYNERFFMEKDCKLLNKKSNYKKSKFNNKSYSRHISKKLGALNNFSIGLSSSKLLKVFKKKNTSKIERNINKKKSMRRTGQMFNLEDFAESLKQELNKKPEINMEKYSILERKNFFNLPRKIKEREKESKKTIRNLIKRDSVDLNNKIMNEKGNESDNGNEEQFDSEKIYFELMKYIMEGKNKNFEKYYEANINFIDINQELYEGNTLLILCSAEGNYFVAKFLCERGAEVNIQNKSGNTALHYAIGKQFYSIADILTRYGAREDIKNIKGLTPWDCIENNIE